MKKDQIRSFIAIPLPRQAALDLQAWIDQLKIQQKSGVRWVNTTNLHLTLKFLGDIDPAVIPDIQVAMQQTARSFHSFTFTLQGLGAFPGLFKPRVIWAGIQAPPVLKALHRQLDASLQAIGFPAEDRPFSPHLTLGRVDRYANDTDIAAISALIKKPHQEKIERIPVDALHLYRSELKPGGPIYTLLFQAPLQENH